MNSAPEAADEPAVTEAIEKVQQILETERGALELSRLSGVPYTTLRDWKSNGVPRAAFTLAKLAPAADQLIADRAETEAAA